MARLDLKVGFSCNNRCLFCVQGEKRNEEKDRTGDEIRAILKDNEGGGGVVFTGGEPTLRQDLVELVGDARELGYSPIQVQTNGRRVAYRPYIDALVEAGMTEISPALHGSRPEIHDGLTRAKGSFRQVVQGIKNAISLNLPVLTNTVVTQQNIKDLPNIADLLLRLGVRHIQYAYVHPAGTAGTLFQSVVPRFSDAAPYIQRGLDLIRAAGARGCTEAVPYCFAQGYESCVIEQHIPDTRVVDAPMIIEDYTKYRLKEGKAHGPPCEECSFAGICEGPWHEYPREYGWTEFRPRKDDPAALD